MDAKGYMQQQFLAMRRLSAAAIDGTTDAQLNWTPPGQVHAIKGALVHLIASEDRLIQSVIQGKPMLWASDGWGGRLGLGAAPGMGQGWEEVAQTTLAVAPIQAYRQAVQAATEAYLAALTPDELDRRVLFIRGEAPVAQVLSTIVVHVMGHAGEIAALKGLQGVKGLPF